jgi:TolB-like protein/Tfp pilus assembly protein PilF
MSGSTIRRFVRELRRRKVFRVAAVYAAVAFVTLQAADLLVPALHLPAWTFSFLVLLTLFGFPLAIVLAWAYEITPLGVRRTETPAEAGARPAPGLAPAGPDLVVVAALAVVLVAGGIAVSGRGGAEAGSPPDGLADRSLAVLPVALPGGGDDYFSDGVTEDIMTRLAGVEGLSVVSWTSVMPYRGSGKGIRQIGDELGVGHVVEVSARRHADEVRIRVRLVDARADRTVWSEQYDRRVDNVFQVQAEIAERVTTALQARLSPSDRQAVAGAPTADMDAYDLFLRGREQFHRHRRDANALAIALFREAIELDPDFALAHAWLARAYGANRHRFGDDARWLDSAEVAARRALALDTDLAEAHRNLGTARYFAGSPRDALPHYERALELQPGSPETVNNLGLAYYRLGRTDEAIRWLRRAAAADPVVAVSAWTNLGGIYLQLDLYDHADAAVRRALAAEGASPITRVVEAWIRLFQGRPDEAMASAVDIAEDHRDSARALLGAAEILVVGGELTLAEPLAERAYALSPFAWNVAHFAPVLLAYIFLGRGEVDRAARLLDEVVAYADRELGGNAGDNRMHYTLAAAHALRGSPEDALDHLDEAIRTGWRYYPLVRIDPLLDPLRQDPRFEEILDRLGSIMDDLRSRVEAEHP